MATKQGTTQRFGADGTGGLGGIGDLSTSNTARLAELFPSSPVNVINALLDDGTKDPTTNELYKHYMAVARGTIDNNPDFPEGVDLTFNTADNKLGDKGPNTLGAADTGGAGLPASAFVPNPVSPGQGNGVSAAAQVAAPEGYGLQPTSSPPGEGVGSQLGVQESSAAQAGAAGTLGSYGLGKSPYASE